MCVEGIPMAAQAGWCAGEKGGVRWLSRQAEPQNLTLTSTLPPPPTPPEGGGAQGLCKRAQAHN